MQRRRQNYEKTRDENTSFRPIAIGFLLILIVIILFFSKKFLFNKEDKDLISETTKEKSEKISVPMILSEDLSKLIHTKTHQLIDIRSTSEFEYSHLENSKNIPIDSLKNQSKSLNKDIPIIIIDQTETKQGKEATHYLNKLGFSAKYLVGGIAKFSEKGYSVISIGDPDSFTDIAKVNPISPEEIIEKIATELGSIKFLDVRSKEQFEEYHVEGSINIPLEEIEKRKKEIPISKLIVVDEDSTRSFQAAVRLSDMNFMGVYCLKTSLSNLKDYIKNKNSSDTKVTNTEN